MVKESTTSVKSKDKVEHCGKKYYQDEGGNAVYVLGLEVRYFTMYQQQLVSGQV